MFSEYWVAYHIGVGWSIDEWTDQWIAAGYYTQRGLGTVFYIEWFLNDTYYEIFVEGVMFDKPFYVIVYAAVQEGWEGWAAHVWDNEWNLMLYKYVDLPISGMDILAVAGGESICPYNYMSALFADLRWTAEYEESGGPHELGDGYISDYWNGNDFSCELIEDWPYDVNVIKPYYEFSVSGGKEEEPSGGGGRHGIYTIP